MVATASGSSIVCAGIFQLPDRIGDDGKGWIGTDFNKFWFKYDGFVTNGVASDGDQEFLHDKPIPRLRYFDWQVGARVDLDSGPRRVWLALGIQELAPYFFNLHQHFMFAMEDMSPEGSKATMICTSPNG